MLSAADQAVSDDLDPASMNRVKIRDFSLSILEPVYPEQIGD